MDTCNDISLYIAIYILICIYIHWYIDCANSIVRRVHVYCLDARRSVSTAHGPPSGVGLPARMRGCTTRKRAFALAHFENVCVNVYNTHVYTCNVFMYMYAS